MRYLLDTNICSYLMRQRPPEVIARFKRLRPGDTGMSVITLGELRYGAERHEQREKIFGLLTELLEVVPCVPLPSEASTSYGRLRAHLAGHGQMIGGNDLWIAAHALADDLVVVTNNEREFKRVPGLRVQNWVSPA